MKEILIAALSEELPLINSSKIRRDADVFLAYYTGEGQDDILFDYRKSENKDQKNQRKRITIPRTKHVMGNVENLLDQLNILDTPAIRIKATSKEEQLLNVVYDMDVAQMAFDYVKYQNLVDSNSFLVGGINELNEPEFTVIDSHNVLHFKLKNDRLQYLITEHKSEKTLKEYRLYHQKGVIKLTPKKTDDAEFIRIKNQNYYLTEIKTNRLYAYPLGYLKDASTKFTTFKTITDVASHLFKQLIWDGSEHDTIKGTHGIIKTFAYAPKCTYVHETDKGIIRCVDGQLAGADSGPCPSCNGSGMRTHLSSQDIVYIPEPLSQDQATPLEKMIYTVTIPDSILNTRKQDIKDTENAILRSIFNGNSIERADIAKTATEANLEMKGLYSTLHKLGFKVSNTYIWMVEVIADIIGAGGVEVFHGYTMDLNVDSLEDLFEQRKKAVDSGASNDIIEVIDYMIQKKQHVDNPDAINRFAIWENHRPFRDKTATERLAIIATMDDDNPFRLLYLYWATIQTNVDEKYGEKFYDANYQQQNEMINKEIEELKQLLPERPEPVNFDEF
jgi:hypothetical protein